MARANSRREQVLTLIRESPVPLDDDQIARSAEMNRVNVNAICRQLAQDNLIVRDHNEAGKIVNTTAGRGDPSRDENVHDSFPEVPRRIHRSRQPPAERLADRIEQLTAGFSENIAAFEARQAFPGPSLYFHLRAIERRRLHETVTSLLDDHLFLDYVYAVLPAWGMHRMGPQTAKVSDFPYITTALKESVPALRQLWPCVSPP